MTDTEAGTPLTWYSPCGYRAVGLFSVTGPIPTCPECYSQGWSTYPPVAARPATDPAGLDVQRLTLAEKSARKPFVGDPSTVWNDSPAHHARIVADAYARLSVADGPGPEERLREAIERIDVEEAKAMSALQGVVYGEDRVAVLRTLTDLSEAINAAAALSRPLPENREEPSR